MENQNNKVSIYLLVIFLAVFVGSGIFLLINNKKPANQEKTAVDESVVPTVVPTRGLISLNLIGEAIVLKAGDPINLSLKADSDGENVTAFDTVISYDSASIDFIKADSNNPSFTVYPFKKDDRLTLTVVKTGLNNEPTIFKGEEIVKLVFNSKVKGDFSFKILPSFDKETTKFVNEKTEVIYPGVNELTVTVN